MGLLRGVKGGIRKATSVIGVATRRGIRDAMRVELPGLVVEVERCSSDTYPHELTVVLPRVEVRRTKRRAGAEITEEYIYSSLTVVHSPRHPLAGGSKTAPSVDSRPARVYTLKRCPTASGRYHPEGCGQSGEVDGRAMDRRDSSDR